MGHGAISPFTQTIASGATLSGTFDLARSWQSTYLEIPTMASNTQMFVQGSADNLNFRRLYHPAANSATVAANVFAIGSAATNCFLPIPNGFRYMKIETTATVDSGNTFRIICGD